MTKSGKGCILKKDTDGLFSLHFWDNKYGEWRRRPMWREVGTEILILDPGRGIETSVGWAIRPTSGIVIAVLRDV